MVTQLPRLDSEDWANDDPEESEELAFLVSLRRDRLADGSTTQWRGIVQDRKSCKTTRVGGWSAVMVAMRAAEATQLSSA